MNYRVLAINPGSTSTKIAVYDDSTPVFEKTLRHDPEELNQFGDLLIRSIFVRHWLWKRWKKIMSIPKV